MKIYSLFPSNNFESLQLATTRPDFLLCSPPLSIAVLYQSGQFITKARKCVLIPLALEQHVNTKHKNDLFVKLISFYSDQLFIIFICVF